MTKFKKYIALRLIALLMFPYSASAAAACNTQLNYSNPADQVFAYEPVAYTLDAVNFRNCVGTSGGISELQVGDISEVATAENFEI